MKRFTNILFLLVPLWCLFSSAQTPFDSFAPEISRPMLDIDFIRARDTYHAQQAITTDTILYFVDITNGNIIASVPLTDELRKWLSVDPLSDKYPNISPYAYCAWNPINKIDPDGEVVHYGYTTGGLLKNVVGLKQGQQNIYLWDRLYDEQGRKIFQQDGNGVWTTYAYDSQRQWLSHLYTELPSGDAMQNLHYIYDPVGNIITIDQSASAPAGTKLGGPYDNHYIYDQQYRLEQSNGKGDFPYTFNAAYSPAGRLGNKSTSAQSLKSDLLFGYDQMRMTHQPRTLFDPQIGTLEFFWDANGNLAQIIGCKQNSGRLHEWDEENRLRFVLGEKFTGYYGYNANGERVYKLTGQSILGQVNSGSIKAQAIFDDAVLYPNPYVVVTSKGYTKHYYTGTERIATVIGTGGFDDMVTTIDNLSSQHDQNIIKAFYSYYQNYDPFFYQKIVSQPEKTEDIHGNPHPDLEYQCTPTELVMVDILNPPDILLKSISVNEQNNGPEKEVYFYHGDHLGSANWITDYTGAPVQYIHYAPYGELIDNQVPYGYDERYKFTGKERDAETGYDFFGARFYWQAGTWLSVDPLADKYPNISPYAYCAWNPIKYTDPDGRIVVFAPGTTNDQKNQFNQALDHLDSHGCGGRYAQLESSEYTYTIIVDDSGISQFDGTDRNNPVIHWSPKKGVKTKNGTVMSPSTVLDHEMDHGCAFDKAKQQLDKENVEAWNEYVATTKPGTSADYGKKEEERVITGVEQTTAQALGEVEPGKVTRTDHSGSYVWVNGPTSNKPIE